MKICPNCKKNQIVEGTYDYCAVCHRHKTIERQHAFKRACLAYKGGSCEFCGVNEESVTMSALYFVRPPNSPKGTKISKLTGSANLSERVKRELDERILVCSNCERSRFRSSPNNVSPLKKKCVALLGGQCSYCGETNAMSLDFHHTDGRGNPTKRFNIGGRSLKRFDQIAVELAKCQLLCANCHARHHFLEKEVERKREGVL